MSNSGPAAREKQHSVRKALLLGCVVAAFGAACGQRGPLYLPDQPPAAPPAESAAAAEEADDARGEAEESEDSASEEEDDEKKSSH